MIKIIMMKSTVFSKNLLDYTKKITFYKPYCIEKERIGLIISFYDVKNSHLRVFFYSNLR